MKKLEMMSRRPTPPSQIFAAGKSEPELPTAKPVITNEADANTRSRNRKRPFQIAFRIEWRRSDDATVSRYVVRDL